jgi:Uncharacterized protein containing a von Willebrand factor type A (vWA) domain
MLCCLLSFLFVWVVPAVAKTEDTDNHKSLSPYFFVESAEESAVEAFPLLDTQVDVEISGVIAQVKVKQRYVNRGNKPIHARYIFPGSIHAAVHGLTMTVGDRVIHAQIKEKQEARHDYETARKGGKSASLLEQQRPNVFSMEVANILPSDTIDVELQYSEILVPEEATYEFVYPTVVGPRYVHQGASKDTNQWVANPYLKKDAAVQTGFSIRTRLAAGMPIQDVSCSTHTVKIDYDGPDVARVSLDSAEFGGNRDYILRYRLADRNIASGLLLFEGEQENFFLLMAQPPSRPNVEMIPGREYFFIVDVSGSMHGFPLDTSKVLINDLISSLKPTDRFNMLFFSGGSAVMAPASVEATQENIHKAIKLFDSYNGRGGTELLPALQQALNMPASEGFSRTMIVVTDGFISAEPEAFDLIRDNLGQSNLFAFGIGSSVNRHLIQGLAKVGRGEPFIITDPSESGAIAQRFRDYISAPLLTDIQVRYEGFDAYDLEPTQIPDLFAQRPMLILGKWRGERKGKIILEGVNGNGVYQQSFALEQTEPDVKNAGLHYLWARERVAQLSDHSGYQRNEQHKDAIITLGLKYNLLTAYTSFVAIDDVVRNTGGEGRNVKQPLPLPAKVSELAVSSVPEPEFWLLLALMLLALAVSLPLKRRPLR